MWFYFLIFCLILVSGCFYKYKLVAENQWLFVFLWFLLFIVAAFRGENVDNDYLNYISAIKDGWGITEPSFYLISYISYDVLGSVKLVFIIYAFLSVSLMMLALKRTATYFYLSLLIYYSVSYVTHDLNQIRAAVGFGFVMLALKPWMENKTRQVMGWITLATLFHFSFMVLFPISFFVKNNSRYFACYIFAIPIVYVLYFLGINVLSLLMKIPILYVQNMAVNYSNWNIDVVSTVNVFSLLVLIKLGIISLFVAFRETLASKFYGFYLFLKLYILGFIFLIFMATLPGAAFRIADVLWVVECLILPMLVLCFKPAWLSTTFLLLLCTYWMWLNYVASDFVRPYYFDFAYE